MDHEVAIDWALKARADPSLEHQLRGDFEIDRRRASGSGETSMSVDSIRPRAEPTTTTIAVRPAAHHDCARDMLSRRPIFLAKRRPMASPPDGLERRIVEQSCRRTPARCKPGMLARQLSSIVLADVVLVGRVGF